MLGSEGFRKLNQNKLMFENLLSDRYVYALIIKF